MSCICYNSTSLKIHQLADLQFDQGHKYVKEVFGRHWRRDTSEASHREKGTSTHLCFKLNVNCVALILWLVRAHQTFVERNSFIAQQN